MTRWMHAPGRWSMKPRRLRKKHRCPMQKQPATRCTQGRRRSMPEMTLIEAIRQGLDEELAQDPNTFILGEDVGARGGVFRATQGLLDKYGPDRVIDSPLAEAIIAGVGVGA